mgnify:CR=1 FL=1
MAQATGLKALTELQVGKEVTRGTLVAATRRIISPSATLQRIEVFHDFSENMDGLLTRTSKAPVKTRAGTEFDITWPADFEQILLPLLSGVKGGVTPTTPGTTPFPARLWTFTPEVAGDPAPDAYTYEFVERSVDDRAEMEAGYGVCTGFDIVSTNEGMSDISMQAVARATVDSTFTSAIALPALTHAASAEWGVWIDDTWANLGTTQISAQILGFTFTYRGAISVGNYLDNRSTLDFSQYEMGVRTADLTLDVVHDPDSAALVQTQEAIKAAGTLLTVRLKLTGPAFIAPDAGLNRHVQIDGAYYHADDSMQTRGNDRDGNLITTLHLLSAYESVQAQDLEITVQNDLVTFP